MFSKISILIILLSYINTFENYEENKLLKVEKLKDNDIVISPKNPKNHKNTMIWMHGVGGSADGYEKYFKDKKTPLGNTFKTRLVNSKVIPMTVSAGLPIASWYDVLDLNMNEKSYNFKHVEENRLRLNKIIDEEVKILKGNSKKVYIGGFSQGCSMALHTGLNYTKQLGGIIGLSGFKFAQTTHPNKMSQEVPILLIHGQDDVVIRWKQVAEKSYLKDNFLNNCKKYSNYNYFTFFILM